MQVGITQTILSNSFCNQNQSYVVPNRTKLCLKAQNISFSITNHNVLHKSVCSDSIHNHYYFIIYSRNLLLKPLFKTTIQYQNIFYGKINIASSSAFTSWRVNLEMLSIPVTCPSLIYIDCGIYDREIRFYVAASLHFSRRTTNKLLDCKHSTNFKTTEICLINSVC